MAIETYPGHAQITYRQVLERVNRVGNALRDVLDVRIEERVLLLLLDCPEFVYCFFGAIKIGAVPIPTNTLFKAADYEYILNDSRARVVVISEALLPQFQAIPRERLRYVREVVVVGNAPVETGNAPVGTGNAPVGSGSATGVDSGDVPVVAGSAPVGTGSALAGSGNATAVDSGDVPVVAGSAPEGMRQFQELLDGGSPELDAEPTLSDDSAFWLYSSGSTGFPKGCVHLQRDMLVCTELYGRGVLDITEHDRCFSVAKLFFAYGLGNGLYFPFGVGATTVLFSGAPTPANVFEIVRQHRPTLFFSVPTNYAQLLAHDAPFDFSSVRWGVSAGEALPPAIFERFQKRFGVTILDGIGSTEITHIFISNQPGAIRPGSSGKPVYGYEIKILDDDGHSVPTGAIGNLLVKGDSTCAAYWNKRARTRDTIEGHWIRTGDKYYEDADGFLWYAGREDDMLKVGGIWVSPIEVENALVDHPAVLEVGVVGREDQDRLIKPLAYVVLAAGYTASPQLGHELVDFVRSKLAEYKRPRWVVFVAELPKTATGKTQRFKLRQQA